MQASSPSQSVAQVSRRVQATGFWVTLVDGEPYIPACPGSGFKTPRRQKEADDNSTVVVACHGGILRDGADNYTSVVKFADLACAEPVREEILPTEQSCGPNGRMVHVAWRYGSGKEDFYSQLSACVDAESERTHYSGHELTWAEAAEARRKPSGARETQLKAAFPRAREFAGVYERQNDGGGLFSSIVPWFLVPARDFARPEWAAASSYYFNTRPAEVLQLAWDFSLARTVYDRIVAERASSSATDAGRVRFYTGTFDHEKSRPLRLGSNSSVLVVPTHVWRVVHDPEAGRAVAFVALNRRARPGEGFEDAPAACSDVCAAAFGRGRRFLDRLYSSVFASDAPAPPLYCCNYADFRANVAPWAPDLGNPDSLVDSAARLLMYDFLTKPLMLEAFSMAFKQGLDWTVI